MISCWPGLCQGHCFQDESGQGASCESRLCCPICPTINHPPARPSGPLVRAAVGPYNHATLCESYRLLRASNTHINAHEAAVHAPQHIATCKAHKLLLPPRWRQNNYTAPLSRSVTCQDSCATTKQLLVIRSFLPHVHNHAAVASSNWCIHHFQLSHSPQHCTVHNSADNAAGEISCVRVQLELVAVAGMRCTFGCG
jgi:hypothetical protein